MSAVDATHDGHSCEQAVAYTTNSISEDCLTLNICESSMTVAQGFGEGAYLSDREANKCERKTSGYGLDT